MSLAPISPANRLDPQRAQLTAAAKQFEAIFVRQMLAEARKTSFGGDALLGGQALGTFRQMQDERFAEIAAETGALGIARQVEAALTARLSALPPAGAAGGRTDPDSTVAPVPPLISPASGRGTDSTAAVRDREV